MWQAFTTWAVNSSWFKKWSAAVGGMALGMWVQATYWRQIRDTLGVWDVDKDAYMHALLAIAGAGGIAASVVATLTKQHIDAVGKAERLAREGGATP